MIELKGIAWNHTRGFLPVVATAQRYEETHPGVRITWEKRSLQAFADASMETLAEGYDLIVMDHPHTALAATAGLLLPLEDWLPADFLSDQAENSVGGSHESYRFQDRQWTLATDAAAPIATWRPDLLDAHGLELPRTWEELLDLARNGFVSPAFFPIDCLMLLYSFCEVLGAPPFSPEDSFAPRAVVSESLARIRELAALCSPECLERNPIRTAEFMSRSGDPSAAYCPFAYGYSNYSRPGYAPHLLLAGDTVEVGGRPLRTTLGGAGVAVSARSAHPEAATDYARFSADPATQRGLWFETGGQPGHRSAWVDDNVNARANEFFIRTLPVLERAFLRPKHPGYMAFQDAATPVAHAAVAGRITPAEAAEQLDRLWATSTSR